MERSISENNDEGEDGSAWVNDGTRPRPVKSGHLLSFQVVISIWCIISESCSQGRVGISKVSHHATLPHHSWPYKSKCNSEQVMTSFLRKHCHQEVHGWVWLSGNCPVLTGVGFNGTRGLNMVTELVYECGFSTVSSNRGWQYNYTPHFPLSSLVLLFCTCLSGARLQPNTVRIWSMSEWEWHSSDSYKSAIGGTSETSW